MVSIIIPVFNVREYLEECIGSVRRQTLSDIEIILVDDGSTDGSAELCDQYAETDNRICVIHQQNSGSTKARNEGLRASHGEYIGFVDSDDWIEPDMYERLLATCTAYSADIVSSVKFINHEKSEYKEEQGVPAGCYDKYSTDKELIRNLIYSEDFKSRGISPNLYDKLFKRELLLKHQFSVNERIRYGEDDVCVYSCLINADRVVVVDKAFYHYRQHEGSVCHTHDDTYFEGITWFYQQIKQQFQQHYYANVLMEQLDRYMIEFVLRGINRHFGFGFGVVVPFYWPPYRLITGMQKVALYGAGNVGQDYYRALQLWGNVEVSIWVDRQYKNYHETSLPVDDISGLVNAEYDAVLIAVEKKSLASQIREELIRYGVAEEKIIYSEPQKLIQNIGR